MYRHAVARRIWWPAIVRVAADFGAVEEHEIELQFDLLNQEELKEVRSMPDADADAFLGSRVHDWRNVADEHEAELPFTAEHLDAAMQIPSFTRAIATALVEASMGIPHEKVVEQTP